MKNMIMTITGPSASGKSTLERKLVERGFAKLTSVTTRPMRSGEVNGIDYHYVTEETFDEMADGGGLVESVRFGGYAYGVPAFEVEAAFAAGKPVVVVVEPDGAEQIAKYGKTHGWRVFRVFVHGKLETLIERYLRRANGINDANVSSIAKRIAAIPAEFCWVAKFKWDVTIEDFGPETEADAIDFLVGHAINSGYTNLYIEGRLAVNC